MALGAASTAGLKGWYYSKIVFGDNPVITLSDKQPYVFLGNLIGGAWSSDTPNIKAGDKISIVNNSKYDYCGEVKSVSGNKITLNASLPFDTLDVGTIAVNNPDDWTIYLPDNESAGIIDFGGGALAEGVNTKATNIGAHAEGIQTHAYGQYSHTEGFRTTAAYASHAEGRETEASGLMSHAEGRNTVASGDVSHAEGYGVTIDGTLYKTIASGKASHAEGRGTEATGDNSHAEGYLSKASATLAHAEGHTTTASGTSSHSEGRETSSSGNYSHAEGLYSISSGVAAHAEGKETIASGDNSHSEGYNTEASGNASHAEGRGVTIDGVLYKTLASGNYSHAEGRGSVASGEISHAEGYRTVASGAQSHAEGYETISGGTRSHAGGRGSVAEGNTSFAHGSYVKTTNANEVAFGTYNDSQEGTVFSIGNGTSDKERSNIFEIGHEKDAEGYSESTVPYMSLGYQHFGSEKTNINSNRVSISSNGEVDGGGIISLSTNGYSDEQVGNCSITMMSGGVLDIHHDSGLNEDESIPDGSSISMAGDAENGHVIMMSSDGILAEAKKIINLTAEDDTKYCGIQISTVDGLEEVDLFCTSDSYDFEDNYTGYHSSISLSKGNIRLNGSTYIFREDPDCKVVTIKDLQKELSYANQTPLNNVIYYTTSDSRPVTLGSNFFGVGGNEDGDSWNVTLVSNTYKNDVGVILCNRDILTIGSSMFADCETLTSVIIPDTVYRIHENAFYNCTNLQSITVGSGVGTIDANAFTNCTGEVTLKCSALSTSYSSSDDYTTFFGNKLLSGSNFSKVIIDTPVVGDYAFRYNEYIKELEIAPNTKVGNGAFSHIHSMTKCIVGDGVEFVRSTGTASNSIFYNCDNLTDVELHNITSIPGAAFYKSENLININIPNTVVSIGAQAFQYTGIRNITIPASVETIGQKALSNCENLQNIYCRSSTPPTLGVSTIDDINIYIPQKALASYEVATN